MVREYADLALAAMMIVTLHFVQQQVLAGSSSLFCDKDWQTLVASYYPHCSCTAELLTVHPA